MMKPPSNEVYISMEFRSSDVVTSMLPLHLGRMHLPIAMFGDLLLQRVRAHILRISVKETVVISFTVYPGIKSYTHDAPVVCPNVNTTTLHDRST